MFRLISIAENENVLSCIPNKYDFLLWDIKGDTSKNFHAAIFNAIKAYSAPPKKKTHETLLMCYVF